MPRPRIKNVSPGERYGRGTVIAEITLMRRKLPARGVLLRCDCGNLYEVSIYDLLRNDGKSPTRSCGCLVWDTPSQGLSRTHELYGTWSDMMSRCFNPKVPSYRFYGARGITVCERWRNARNFIEDIERLLGPRPAGMSLDRIDGNAEYAPGTVRWATRMQQAESHGRRIDGMRNDQLYRSWWHLMQCYPDEVCSRWHDLAAFRSDIGRLLGPRPDGKRLSRVNSGLPYQPGNVSWVTKAEQFRRAQAARWP